MSTKLDGKNSIESIVNEMTLEEKLDFLTGKTTFSSYEFEKYGIPSILYLDSAAGVNLLQYTMEAVAQIEAQEQGENQKEKKNAGGLLVMMDNMALVKQVVSNIFQPEKLSGKAKKVCDYLYENVIPNGKFPSAFPAGMALGASWNPQAVRKVGEAVGMEAAAYKVDIMLGTPNVNIHRDPLNGRLFEGFSEDPHLVSALAPEIVKGVQAQGVGADVKHFAANNQETLRKGINEHIPERALYEIYFPGFKACVQNAKPMTVMSAYNKINGVDCAHNKRLLTDVLRDEWGFEGFVVSDWGAVYDQVEALKAGNDVDMPGPRDISPVLNAVKDGRLDEKAIDLAVRRVLLSIVDIMEMRKTRSTDFDRKISREAAYELAAESIVLLKNENNVLPLGKDCKLSFYGEKSKGFLLSGEGSGVVITDQATSMIKEAGLKTGEENVLFEKIAVDTEVVVVTAALSSSEGTDHTTMELEIDEKSMVMNALKEAKDAGKKTVLVLNSSGPVETQDFIDYADAVLWVSYPGMEGGRAAADILFGDVNPSGKLPLTFPRRYKDCPTNRNFPGEFGEVWYGEGIYVGYRYYDTKDIEPLFPFGYGLSYSEFEISDLKLQTEQWNMEEENTLRASVRVKNIGNMKGSEVVQIYVSHKNPTIAKPEKELKHFEKVCLQPGEEIDLMFKLDIEDLKSYDSAYKQWVAEPGTYRILVGNSSRNISCEQEFQLIGHSIYDFGADTPMIKILAEQKAVDVIRKHASGMVDVEQFLGSFDFMPYQAFGRAWTVTAGSFLDEKVSKELFEKICIDLKNIKL